MFHQLLSVNLIVIGLASGLDCSTHHPEVHSDLTAAGVDSAFECKRKLGPCTIYYNTPTSSSSSAKVYAQCAGIGADQGFCALGLYIADFPKTESSFMKDLDLYMWDGLSGWRGVKAVGPAMVTASTDVAYTNPQGARTNNLCELAFSVPADVPGGLGNQRIVYATHSSINFAYHEHYGGAAFDLSTVSAAATTPTPATTPTATEAITDTQAITATGATTTKKATATTTFAALSFVNADNVDHLSIGKTGRATIRIHQASETSFLSITSVYPNIEVHQTSEDDDDTRHQLTLDSTSNSYDVTFKSGRVAKLVFDEITPSGVKVSFDAKSLMLAIDSQDCSAAVEEVEENTTAASVAKKDQENTTDVPLKAEADNQCNPGFMCDAVFKACHLQKAIHPAGGRFRKVRRGASHTVRGSSFAVLVAMATYILM